MRPYGLNGSFAARCLVPYGMDVGDVQRALPKGYRIRNKKQKRRNERKRTRGVHRRLVIKLVNEATTQDTLPLVQD